MTDARVEEIRQKHAPGAPAIETNAQTHGQSIRDIVFLLARIGELERDRDEWMDRHSLEVRRAANVIERMNQAEQRVAAVEGALRDLLNYAEPPCGASLEGECDKGYHNDHALAIKRAEALLPTPPAAAKAKRGLTETEARKIVNADLWGPAPKEREHEQD